MSYRLYHYWRSSSSWRVRWAFAIKKISCEFLPVDLLKKEQTSPEHLQKNPAGTVPVLEILDGKKRVAARIAESTAIIEWAEESFSEPKLLPSDPVKRAKIRQLSQIINSGIQPVQNLKVQQYYSEVKEKQKAWAQHWIRKGLQTYETLVKETAGKFSVGDEITMADLFLIPQCYNAERYEVSLKEFPTIAKINANALNTEACKAAHPDRFKPASSG